MYNIICHSICFIIGAIFIPSPADHHFIWPLSNCLMADICNHTWIPECGKEEEDLRRFIDECDLFEYNCDYERNYELVNYSDCFQPATGCPKAKACPPKPACKTKQTPSTPNAGIKFKFHRMGHHPERRNAITMRTPPESLPMRMLKGKRRYTPHTWRKTIHRIGITPSTTKTTIRKPLYTGTTVKMVVLNREIVFRNGKKILRVVKGPAIYAELYKDQKSDFLENR